MDILYDGKLRNGLILALQKAIINSPFGEEDWRELGYKTNTIDYLKNHHRLFRSLQWGDDDLPPQIRTPDYANFCCFSKSAGLK